MTRPEGSTPVFVDASGRRRRRVRRIAYAVGAACLTYTGLVGASVIGHSAHPGALAPLPADWPRPGVPQIRPPDRPEVGVPLPPRDRRLDLEAAAVRLRTPARPAAPRPSSPLRIESTPLPTPTTTPTEPPPSPQPEPEPTNPPEPTPTDPPAPEPTMPPSPDPTPEEPPAGLPVVGPILGLLSGGSARR